MPLDPMDYWRLADELNVIDAAILITGNDPSNTHNYDEGNETITAQTRNYDGFDAAFKALRNAVLSNKIRARVAFPARDAESERCYDNLTESFYFNVGTARSGESACKYQDIIRIENGSLGRIFSNTELNISDAPIDIFIHKEPIWEDTTILVEDIKMWLKTKNIHPAFFFPTGVVEGFRDKQHPRYSPKLACAVAAWETVKKSKKTQSVKQTLQDWIRANAGFYDMVGKDGTPAPNAVLEVAIVVNWDTKGGATPTGGSAIAPESETPPQNFPHEHLLSSPPDDEIDEVPF